MPLNLGNLTDLVVSDIPVEDMYLDFLEADQQFINLMNAIEIAEKAKATQSTECIAFAEELLGTSCESILNASLEDSSTLYRNFLKSLNSAKYTADSLRDFYWNLGKKVGRDPVYVLIPGLIYNLGATFNVISENMMFDRLSQPRQNKEMSLDDAIDRYRNAMNFIRGFVNIYNPEHKDLVKRDDRDEDIKRPSREKAATAGRVRYGLAHSNDIYHRYLKARRGIIDAVSLAMKFKKQAAALVNRSDKGGTVSKTVHAPGVNFDH